MEHRFQEADSKINKHHPELVQKSCSPMQKPHLQTLRLHFKNQCTFMIKIQINGNKVQI